MIVHFCFCALHNTYYNYFDYIKYLLNATIHIVHKWCIFGLRNISENIHCSIIFNSDRLKEKCIKKVNKHIHNKSI